ncbi:MAG: metallophosphoesterase family protein [Treponema sp.]|nr:metallophosphoesterase family protein [Candidatus Treponema equifaecale]
MKFLVLSDIHGDLNNIEKLDPQFKEADAVLFGGDFALFEHEETGKPVLDALLKKHENIFSVLGNCDNPDFIGDIESADVSVQGYLTFHEGIAICGAGGGTKFTGTTPNEREEDEILSDFDVVENSSEECADENGHWSNLVLIMHNPPKETKCDALPNGIHVGSEKLRAYIEKRAPFLVVTGHIHEGTGIDEIGGTTVINPGSLAEGKYGWVEADKNSDGIWKVSKAELRNL